jgi:predicted DNA binding CopG/RHH family protein
MTNATERKELEIPAGFENIDFNDESRYTTEVADAETTEAINRAAGTQLVSIRMSTDMIESMKAIGAKHGIGYQTLTKQIIQRFIDSEMRMMWNDFIAEQTKAQESAAKKPPRSRRKTVDKKAA